jgi:hypothetical protein
MGTVVFAKPIYETSKAVSVVLDTTENFPSTSEMVLEPSFPRIEAKGKGLFVERSVTIPFTLSCA